MTNHKRTETAAKLKKFYSTLSNAIKLSEIETGLNASEWDYTLDYKDFFEEYLAKYFSYTKIEINQNNQHVLYGLYSVYLNDGTVMGLEPGGDNWKGFYFDVNGEKGPNQFGRDVYFYEMDNHSGLCSGDYTRELALENCKNYSDRSCAQLIMIDGWEFKDDYPYRL